MKTTTEKKKAIKKPTRYATIALLNKSMNVLEAKIAEEIEKLRDKSDESEHRVDILSTDTKTLKDSISKVEKTSSRPLKKILENLKKYLT